MSAVTGTQALLFVLTWRAARRARAEADDAAQCWKAARASARRADRAERIVRDILGDLAAARVLSIAIRPEDSPPGHA